MLNKAKLKLTNRCKNFINLRISTIAVIFVIIYLCGPEWFSRWVEYFVTVFT